MVPMNEYLTIFLNTYLANQSGIVDSIIIFVARILPWVILGVFGVEVLGRALHQPKILVRSLLALVSANILAAVLKFIFSKPRPFEVLSDIMPLFYYSDLGSFPSGHALVFAVVAGLGVWWKSSIAWLYIMSLLGIMLARVASGIHFVADVLVGACIGFALVYILSLWWNKKSR